MSFNSKNILSEARGIKSKKIYDAFKKYGGFHKNDVHHAVDDVNKLTDQDVIGVFTKDDINRLCPNPDRSVEAQLYAWVKLKGIEIAPQDIVDTIRLGDNIHYIVVIVRNGRLYPDVQGGWKDHYDKTNAREKNRHFAGRTTPYHWSNKEAEDIFHNPYFKKWPREHQVAKMDKARNYRMNEDRERVYLYDKICSMLDESIENKLKKNHHLNEGSWGYKANESDYSLDHQDNWFFKIVSETIKETKNPSDADDAWANICIINTLINFFKKDTPHGLYFITDGLLDNFELSIEKCEKDKTWVSNWRDPEKIKKSLSEYRKLLENIKKEDRAKTERVKRAEKDLKIKLTENLDNAVENKLKNSRKDVDTNPTEPQKKAGNYKMGHISINGFQISIENPKGSYRCGKDRNGKEWKQLMHNDYGYFTRTVGKDGDAIDVFIGDNYESSKIFAVDQKVSGEFDETKVMFCFNTIEQAKKAYLSNYSKDWKGFWKITETDINTFKKWLYDGHRQRKPFAEYVVFNKKEKGSQNANK